MLSIARICSSGRLAYPARSSSPSLAHPPAKLRLFLPGRLEEQTCNSVLQMVQETTEAICGFFREQSTTFQLNAGERHDHPAKQAVVGIGWMTNG